MPGANEGAAAREPFQLLAKHSGLPEDTRPEQALHPGDKVHGDTLAKFVDFLVQHLTLVAPTSHPSDPLGAGCRGVCRAS